MLFTYLLGFGGDIVPYLLEFRLCRHGEFFKVIDCKKIAGQVHQKAIPIIEHSRKSYCADNAIDKATINLPNFLLVVADSTSPKGTFRGSSSGTWIDGFCIKRPAL